MPLTLEQWDHQVGHHLRSIATECQLILQHARAITRRPDWETRCEDELVAAAFALAEANLRLIEALRIIKGKARDV